MGGFWHLWKLEPKNCRVEFVFLSNKSFGTSEESSELYPDKNYQIQPKKIAMKKILLVEDDHHLGIILSDQLEMNGYEVRLVRIPSKTIENLLEDQFDLVIMDKLLRGMDGTEICAQIRNTDGISDTPILMMSGMDGAHTVCKAAGATNFIAKPFEVDGFLKSIKDSIEKEKNNAEVNF